MSFLGLEYVAPAFIDAVRAEELVPKLAGGAEPVVLGPVRWHVEIGLEPRSFARHGGALAAHRAQHGMSRAFQLPMPQLVGGEVPDGAVLDVARSERPGSATITLRAGAHITLPVGRFIAFSGHAKVYQVTGGGDHLLPPEGAAVPVVPALQAGVGQGEEWLFAPALTCRYALGSGAAWSIDGRGIVAPVIAVEEV